MDLESYSRNYYDQYRDGEFETVMAALRRDKVLQSVARYPHATMLEVGCGLEPLFPHVRDYERYWVVEPQERAAEAARLHPAATPSLTVVDGFLESAGSVLPPRFDFIVVSSLLHEVPDPDALLKAVASHCDAKTVVHVNVPNVRSFHRLLALEAGLIPDLFEKSATEERFQRQTRFDRERLHDVMTANGFEVLEFDTYFVKPFTHEQMAKMLSNGIIDARILAGLDRMTRHLPEMGCEMSVNVRLSA